MNQPLRLSPELILNEYHVQLANAHGELIRARCTISILEHDRNQAWARVAELEEELRGRKSAEAETIHVGSSPGV